jgi:hypothetical protein
MTARTSGRAEVAADEGGRATRVERNSPGLTALFAGLRADGGHSVLDLGPARAAHLRLLGRFAHQIRFVGLVPEGGAEGVSPEAIQRLAGNADAPYDVVLAWDILDHLAPEDRTRLMDRLAEITAPSVRIFFMVDASGLGMRPRWSFTLTDSGKMIQVEVGAPQPSPPELLPAAVERLLGPFELQHAFYVRSGWREYLATKRRS